VKIAPWLGAVLVLGFAVPALPAGDSMCGRFYLDRTNRKLNGRVIDFTHNHGKDRRFWSDALQCARDMYVYVPPGYDPAKQYPVALWLHGFREDEIGFLESIVPRIDELMSCGKLPRMIVACPDGSIHGRRTFIVAGSFYVNSKAGRFQDMIVEDVWPFLQQHFSLRPERAAHALLGGSMGGGAAFNIGMKHPDKFQVIVGVFPPLNLRWEDCHGNARANFDPCCWGWREKIRCHETVACMFGLPIKMWQLVKPIYGTGPDAIHMVAAENPIEIMERVNLQPGQLAMYIAYGGRDQFNIDAEVESFLCKARERGLEITTDYDPRGRHGPLTALRLIPNIAVWLTEQLGPYDPGE